MENQLNEDFCNVCDWFVNNKLSIHFGGHKTKSILFPSKFKRTNSRKLYIKYGNIQIKQHSAIKYLGCLLSGEAMALDVINKINKKLKFLYRKIVF